MGTNFKKLAWLLSLAGILPFIAPVIWLYFSHDDTALLARAQLYLVSYGAIILSFLGGIRWGLALSEEAKPRDLSLSVIPSLIGWCSLLLPQMVQLPLLALAFISQWFWDYRTAQNGEMPLWFGRLRTVISASVLVLLLLAIASNFIV